MADETKLRELAQAVIEADAAIAALGGFADRAAWMGAMNRQTAATMSFLGGATPATVLALLDRLEAAEITAGGRKAALDEWFAKTDWVQAAAEPNELGMHRADVLARRIAILTVKWTSLLAEVDALKADNETLRASANGEATERARLEDAAPGWLPGTINPANPGVYQCQYAGDAGIDILQWTGKQWRRGAPWNHVAAFGLNPLDRWYAGSNRPNIERQNTEASN